MVRCAGGFLSESSRPPQNSAPLVSQRRKWSQGVLSIAQGSPSRKGVARVQLQAALLLSHAPIRLTPPPLAREMKTSQSLPTAKSLQVVQAASVTGNDLGSCPTLGSQAGVAERCGAQVWTYSGSFKVKERADDVLAGCW